MSGALELTDILEKDEVEMVYRRELRDDEWETIKYNLKTRFFSRIRKEMLSLIEDMPDYFLEEK
ncbi:MAG: hypothetical protein KAV45_01425 [Calditrichia bacterium]|nr:hypothetical protein [Calditrichia bacterium]